MSVGLATNEISFADAFSKGGRQQDKEIQNFKASSDVNVLLLATKSGANGLNLTEATNVILAEPVMSPAVEAQAVSRVLRIGQSKDTHVYRLIVKGTIEEKIVKMQQSRRVAPSTATESSPTKGAGVARRDGTPRRGRRGAEDHLTVADLRSLFAGHVTAGTALQSCASGGSSTAGAIDLSAENEHGQAISDSSNSEFWNARVLYNTRAVPREDAATSINML